MRRRDDDRYGLFRRKPVGIDDEVVVDRQFGVEMVEPPKVVRPLQIGVAHRLLGNATVESARPDQPLGPLFRRGGDQYPQNAVASRQRHGRGVGDDHCSALGRDLFDDFADQAAQTLLTALAERQRDDRVRGVVARTKLGRHGGRYHRGDEPPDQRLALLRLGHPRRVEFGFLGGPFDDLGVDHPESEARRNTLPDLLAAGGEATRDADDLGGHGLLRAGWQLQHGVPTLPRPPPRAASGGEQGSDHLRPLRPPEQKALRLVAAEAAKRLKLALALHALGDDGLVQLAGQGDDRGHDRLVAGILAQIADEGAVDLDHVEW